jgi:hypothetical protein
MVFPALPPIIPVPLDLHKRKLVPRALGGLPCMLTVSTDTIKTDENDERSSRNDKQPMKPIKSMNDQIGTTDDR